MILLIADEKEAPKKDIQLRTRVQKQYPACKQNDQNR